MKKIVVGIGFLIILIILSCATRLPLIIDENIGKPIVISVNSSPDSEHYYNRAEISINYTWNGNKSKFENSQNAVGDITYTFMSGKFVGGSSSYDYGEKMEMQESGIITYYATSSIDEKSFVTGKGSLIFFITCSYKDKNGSDYGGPVSNSLEIPVSFQW
jgi:hypothetical protein